MQISAASWPGGLPVAVALGHGGELPTGGRSQHPSGGVWRCEIGSGRQPSSFRPSTRQRDNPRAGGLVAASSAVRAGHPAVSEGSPSPLSSLWKGGRMNASAKSRGPGVNET